MLSYLTLTHPHSHPHSPTPTLTLTPTLTHTHTHRNPEGLLVFIFEDTLFGVGVDYLLLSLTSGRVSLHFSNFDGRQQSTASAVTMETYNDGRVHQVWVELNEVALTLNVDAQHYDITEYDSGE